jgi:molybdenum cofactor cytidylyltransferase
MDQRMDRRHDLVGVVLGAGSSTRLGRPKQTLPLGDTTLLGWAVRSAEASRLDRVVVVLGGAADHAAASLGTGRATTVHNDAYGTGCASSLLAGLDAAGDTTAAIVMLLGDMPGVDHHIIDTVVTAWQAHPTWAAVTEYDDDRLGHPFVFSADAFATLRTLHGDKAVWKIVDAEPEPRVRRIRIRRPLPRDVDTWDDYLQVCEELGFSSTG